MIGGRFFSSTTRCFRGSLLSTSNTDKQFPSFLLSSSPTTPVSQNPLPIRNIHLSSKRFFQSESNKTKDPFNKSWSSFTSKLFAGFGILLGIGCGGAYNAYHAMKDRDIILANYDLVVTCAEKDQGGCDKDECIPKKCGETRCLREVECEELIIKNANDSLEKSLKEIRAIAIEHTEVAMQAYCDAQPLVCEFLNLGYGNIANDDLESPEYEESWCYLHGLAKRRCVKVRDAIEKGLCAWELLSRLRCEIENGRACRYTSCNPLLTTAEESLVCAERDLLNAKAKMEWTQSEHDMVDQYETIIAVFKKELKEDVASKIKAKEKPYTDMKYPEQEKAMILLHAYLKTIRAQKEMAQYLVCTGRVPRRLQDTCC